MESKIGKKQALKAVSQYIIQNWISKVAFEYSNMIVYGFIKTYYIESYENAIQNFILI